MCVNAVRYAEKQRAYLEEQRGSGNLTPEAEASMEFYITRGGLVELGVVKKKLPRAQLLQPDNVDADALKRMARLIATECGLPESTAFCDVNPVQLFDFSSLARCERPLKLLTSDGTVVDATADNAKSAGTLEAARRLSVRLATPCKSPYGRAASASTAASTAASMRCIQPVSRGIRDCKPLVERWRRRGVNCWPSIGRRALRPSIAKAAASSRREVDGGSGDADVSWSENQSARDDAFEEACVRPIAMPRTANKKAAAAAEDSDDDGGMASMMSDFADPKKFDEAGGAVSDKELSSVLAELGLGDDGSDKTAAKGEDALIAALLGNKKPSAAAAKPAAKAPATPTPAAAPKMPPAVEALGNRLLEYQRAAVNARKRGEMDEALHWLRRSKELASACEALLNDFPSAEDQPWVATPDGGAVAAKSERVEQQPDVSEPSPAAVTVDVADEDEAEFSDEEDAEEEAAHAAYMAQANAAMAAASAVASSPPQQHQPSRDCSGLKTTMTMMVLLAHCLFESARL